MDTGHWQTESGIGVPDMDPHNAFGFIYRVDCLRNGKSYIGKKQYRIGGSKKKASYNQQSDWKKYTTSSKHVNADIRLFGKNEFEFIHLFDCYTKGDLTYQETNLQHKFDVLTEKQEDGSPAWYNRAIGAIKFIPPEKHSDKTRKKISKATKQGMAHLDLTGPNNPMFGKTTSDLQKEVTRSRCLTDNPMHKPENVAKLTGHNNYRARPMDIYNYDTNELVAENVVCTTWCKDKIYNTSKLQLTAKADRSKPSSTNNRHHHRRIYAVYREV